MLTKYPHAYGTPESTAIYRTQPEDFRVSEIAGFDMAGEGDHLCLYLRKSGLNTHDVIDRLVQVFTLAPVDIGYFGLKDRHAVTDQWFSLHLPGKGDEWSKARVNSLGDDVHVLGLGRHTRKLRIGTHLANRFCLVLRQFAGERQAVESRIERVFSSGFPNFFGEQRFGIGGRNLVKAQTMFLSGISNRDERSNRQRKKNHLSRRQRSLYLSAARSFLFNEVLAARLTEGSWLEPLADEKLILNGSRSFFVSSGTSAEELSRLDQRIAELDVHTSGPLWGKESTDSVGSMLEQEILAEYSDYTTGLERAGLTADRRALRALATHGKYRWPDADVLELTFDLPAGSYATSLLREVSDCRSGA